MNCKRRTRPAGLSPSMKTGKPLIISIAAARSWKRKKPSPAGCAARSPGSNSLRHRQDHWWRNATNFRSGQKPREAVTCRFAQGGVQQTTHSGVYDFLQGRFIANGQDGTLQLHQLLLLEIREQAADRLARSANHFRDFSVRERQFYMCRVVRIPRIGRPGEQKLCELL